MASANKNLGGSAPEYCPVALLIVDMINDFVFPGGKELCAQTLPVAKAIAALKKKAKKARVPVIYANDNFGRWRSDFREQVRHCLKDDVPGEPIVRLLKPGKQDYFVLKARHSAFYATPLDLLLQHLRVRTIILTGISGDSCISFTAHDAYLRDYRLILPEDTIASIEPEQNQATLELLKHSLQAKVMPSTALDLELLAQRKSGRH